MHNSERGIMRLRQLVDAWASKLKVSQSSEPRPLHRTPVTTKVIRSMSTSGRPWRNALAASRDGKKEAAKLAVDF
jgi:hypothetical protein